MSLDSKGRGIASLAAILAVVAAARNAQSEPSAVARTFDLGRLIDQGVSFLDQRTQTRGTGMPSDVTLRLRMPSLRELEGMFPSRDPAIRDRFIQMETPEAIVATTGRAAAYKGMDRQEDPSQGTFQTGLRLSLVARDWKGAVSLMGRGTVPTDQIRLTRSSRMLIGRMSVGEGAIVPFLHVGAGEWRYDPDLLPFFTRHQEFAVQFSGGFAVRITRHMAFAWESNYVLLCPTRPEMPALTNPYLFASFGVLNIQY